MRRVLVLGCSGAGKSTLATELAELTGLPLIHMDRLYWRPGWVVAEREEWEAGLSAELKKDAWVIDGNYTRTLPMRLRFADTAILLDLPMWLCFWRVLKRALAWRGRTRSDMQEGCPEHVDLPLLRFVVGFRREQRPKVLALLEQFSGRVIVLRSRSEVQAYLRGLKRDGGGFDSSGAHRLVEKI